MKKRKFAGRILAAAASAAMAVSAVTAPASAEPEPEVNEGATPVNDKFTVTIVPGENTRRPKAGETSLEQRFRAFQIFAGDLNTATDGTGYDQGSASGNKTPNSNQLADIEWGSGINSSKLSDLVNALASMQETLGGIGLTATDEIYTELAGIYTINGPDTTLGEIFTEALLDAGYTNDEGTIAVPEGGTPTFNDAAHIIAKVISDINNPNNDAEHPAISGNAKLANAVAKVLATKSGDDYSYLNNGTGGYTDSSWVPDSSGDGNWKIEVGSAGYYFIADQYTGNDDEISKYILAVFGNQKIYIKSNAATVDKKIVEDNDELLGTSAAIGDTVSFKLTGTLPENFDEYKVFKYTFTDTLSKGLTFDISDTDSFAVTIKIGNTKHKIGKADSGAKNGYAVSYTPEDEGVAHTLNIEFADLRNSKLKIYDDTAEDYAETDNPLLVPGLDVTTVEIIVEYDAVLNKYAEVVAPGVDYTTAADNRNKNSVKLVYSNNANKSGTGAEGDPNSQGETPEKPVYVYTFGFEFIKQDGLEFEDLAGASFSLSDADDKVAVFTKTEEDGVIEYAVAGWIAKTDAEELIDPDADKNWDAQFAHDDFEEGAFAEDADGYYLAITSAVDKTINIKGIKPGTYKLSEEITPDGYTTMAPVSFTVEEPVINGADGSLTSYVVRTATVRADVDLDGAEAGVLSLTSTSTTVYPKLTLWNMPAGYLPGTGGAGTILFYIGGGLLLTAAVVLIIVSNAKKSKN